MPVPGRLKLHHLAVVHRPRAPEHHQRGAAPPPGRPPDPAARAGTRVAHDRPERQAQAPRPADRARASTASWPAAVSRRSRRPTKARFAAGDEDAHGESPNGRGSDGLELSNIKDRAARIPFSESPGFPPVFGLLAAGHQPIILTKLSSGVAYAPFEMKISLAGPGVRLAAAVDRGVSQPGRKPGHAAELTSTTWSETTTTSRSRTSPTWRVHPVIGQVMRGII